MLDGIGLELRGVVDEKRHRPERRLRRPDETADGLGVREIGVNHGCASARRPNGGGEFLSGITRPMAVDCDRISSAAQALGDDPSDALRGARDERDLSGTCRHAGPRYDVNRVSAKAGTRASKSASQATSLGWASRQRPSKRRSR